MIREKIVPVLWLLVAAVIIGVAAGAQAHADTTAGDRYAELHAVDICLALDANPTAQGVAQEALHLMSLGLTPTDAGDALADSVLDVCRIHIPTLEAFTNAYPSTVTGVTA